jgi:hypothetical protein
VETPTPSGRGRTEPTGASPLSLRLTRARQLIDRGKQQYALDELCEAEVVARGNADAIREVIEFTADFQEQVEPSQQARLEDLVTSLEDDAVAASTRFRGLRRSGPVIAGVLAGLIAAGGAAYGAKATLGSGFLFSCTASQDSKSLDVMGAVVFFLAPVLSLAVFLGRREAKALAVRLVVGTGLMVSAIAVLASQSATYTNVRCSDLWGGGTYSESYSLTYLYVPWATALAMFLLASAVVIGKDREAHRGKRSDATPRPPGNLVSG